ncbi:MAG: putative iron-sulfur cluster-binding metallochaperone [Terriglobales bacterium]
MPDCCSSTSGGGCALPRSNPGSCPVCGSKGKAVQTLTVKSLVRDHTRVVVPATYFFCRNADCEAVYFSDALVFRKADVKVRVGIKEKEDPIPLCYCFEYSRGDIRRDIETLGKTEILKRIKAEVQASFCACEVKNPSGACCLGDITRAIQEARALVVPALASDGRT